MFVPFITVLLISWQNNRVLAYCECGYTVASSLYTELLETDFLHLPNVTFDPDWAVQNYTVSAEEARGPYGKNASTGNVIANPLRSEDDWTGDGLLGGDGGLQLWTRGGIPKDGLIPIAEMATTRQDMLYGSFRVGMKMTGISGTCGAFFWYFNDSQEIDMEFLSQEYNKTSNPVNLVLQSPLSEEAGFNAADTPTFDVHSLPFAPEAEFHEYRFDWSPSAVSFFADGQLLKTMQESVPTSPGHVLLSHWSNGDINWSGGPPSTDAVVTVSYFKAYFNSSLPARAKDWNLRCPDVSAPNATCAVPEVTEPPNGNSSTFFFINQGNSTANQTVYGPQNDGTVHVLYQPWQLGLMMLLLAFAFFC